MLSLRDPLQIKRYTQTKSKWLEEDISCEWKRKKIVVAVLISNKIDFRTKAIVRDRSTLHNDKGNNPTGG